MPRPELTARNDRIVHYCTVYGFPAARVAEWCGVSDTRVRQILTRRRVLPRRVTQADIRRDIPRAAGAAKETR